MLKDSYKIIRFVQGGKNRVIAHGLTLEEAQHWCRDPRTTSSKEGKPRRDGKPWFDGYKYEEGVSLVR